MPLDVNVLLGVRRVHIAEQIAWAISVIRRSDDTSSHARRLMAEAMASHATIEERREADERLEDQVRFLGRHANFALDCIEAIALCGNLDSRMYRRAYDRLNLCSDHRDKTTGRCIVCVAEERTRAEEKRNASKE